MKYIIHNFRAWFQKEKQNFPYFAADDVSDKSSAFGSRHDLTRVETPLPGWVVIGESILVRPYNYSGVIAYIGTTEFASGTWIGIELDAPTGTTSDPVSALVSRRVSSRVLRQRLCCRQERWCCQRSQVFHVSVEVRYIRQGGQADTRQTDRKSAQELQQARDRATSTIRVHAQEREQG